MFEEVSNENDDSSIFCLLAVPLFAVPLFAVPLFAEPLFAVPLFAEPLFAEPLFAEPSYPPTFKDARVETYREIESTKLKLWIFGESDPSVPKLAIVFFFGGGWNSGSPDQFENQAWHFANRGMIAITADYRVKSRQGVQTVNSLFRRLF